MALKTWNGTNWDDHLGTMSLGSSSVSVTTTGATSSAFTAPNLVNQANGAWIAVTTVPTSGNFVVELMESGVSMASGTINNADVVTGWNYVRFTTPYTFATLTASAYAIRIKNSAVNSGTIRQNGSSVALTQCTYNTATSLGATDDAWVGGFNNAGLTPQTWTITGTSTSFGSGTDTSLPTTWAVGWGLFIGSGGNVVFDTTASATMQVKGSIGVGKGGLFDMRPGSAYTNTLIFDNVSDGNFGLIVLGGGLGGQALTTGKTVSVVNTYASGTGTAADPLITQTAHNFAVNDEVVIPGLTYSGNQVRFVISTPTSTQLVLSNTLGGSENAITNTPAVGSHIANMTRNSIIKNTNIAFGFSINNAQTSTTPVSDFSYTRLEYPNCLSGRNVAFGSSTTAVTSTFDGLVLYNNSANGRTSIALAGTGTQTISNLVLYNTRGTNYSAQSGLAVAGGFNKTISGLYHYSNPSSTTTCAALSVSSTSAGNTFNDLHSYGGNSQGSAAGYAIGLYGYANIFNNCSVNSARIQGVLMNNTLINTFNNCNFGTIGTNTIDIKIDTTTLAQATFNDCSFGSATLLSQYLLGLEGTEITFQNMDGNSSKHRWYTNHGSWWSAGSGLTNTTVRTAGSLSVMGAPEDNSAGSSWIFKIPANPTSQVGIFGYVYRNATFSSGTLKVELFLPGTLLTATPDATYTFPTTTVAWLPFNISAYYSGSVARYAQVRITGVTATAGAYFFVDDLYDAGTGNKVAGLDLWDSGKPSEIMVQSDFSVVPSAVWGYSNVTTSANTMGANQVLVDAAITTRATPADVTTALNTYDPPTKAELDTAQSAIQADIANVPTAVENADAVWDEALSGHITAGTAGKIVIDAEANSDVTQAKVDQL